MKERIEQLDSLRGLACLTIMVSHSLAILPEMYTPGQLEVLKRTPLAIIRSGPEAVLFFFVLSGFVLSLPFFRNEVSLPKYYLQRFFRLWLPYVVSLVLAIGMAVSVYNQPLVGLSHWANTERTAPGPGLWIQHLLLLGYFKSGLYNPVLWTLVHIMRITIVFPFLMMWVCRAGWREILVGCAAMSCIGFGADSVLNQQGWRNDYIITLHYAAVFVFGALLSKYRQRLVHEYQSLSRFSRIAIPCAGLLFYTHAYWLLPDHRILHYAIPRDWIVCVGLGFGITAAMGSARISGLLVRPPLLAIAKISFSIYLYHAIVLLTIVHLLYGRTPLWIIWLASWSTTFVVAVVAHVLVERPSNGLGRRLAQRWSNVSPQNSNANENRYSKDGKRLGRRVPVRL